MARLKSLRARSDAGYALIEVIVSCVVLALAALAVLSGIDGAQSSTGREKARSVAAALAEQDQERLRAMPVSALGSYGTVTTPMTVGGAAYNVTSKVEWVRDSDGGTVSCENDDKVADYLHVVTTVTSGNVGPRTSPVRIDSIVAPEIAYSSAHGDLAVKVINSAGQPDVGLMVTLTGASSPPATLTNSQGCAFFQNIQSGAYTSTLNVAGWVDRKNQQIATKPVTVTAGAVTTLQMSYDRAASINATVQTYLPGSTTVIASMAKRVSAVNSADLSMLVNEPDPTAVPNPTETGSFTIKNLFPFSSAYSTFTGACKYSAPTAYSANANYYSTYPGAVGLSPGTPSPVNVRQPPLNLRMTADKSGTGTNNTPAGMKVVAIPVQGAGDSCVEPNITLATFNVGTNIAPSTANHGYIGRSLNGTTFDAGIPFGTYHICIERGSGSTLQHTLYPDNYGGTTYDNTLPQGQPTTLTFSASASSKWTSTKITGFSTAGCS